MSYIPVCAWRQEVQAAVNTGVAHANALNARLHPLILGKHAVDVAEDRRPTAQHSDTQPSEADNGMHTWIVSSEECLMKKLLGKRIEEEPTYCGQAA